MLTGPETFTRIDDLYAAMSNAEMATILDGGSARLVARPNSLSPDRGMDWCTAWLDLDGLWIDDPTDCGYVGILRLWEVDHAY